MDKIYRYVKQQNIGYVRHVVLFAAMSLWALSGFLSDAGEKGDLFETGSIPLIVSAVLLGTLVPWEFIRKHTVLSADAGSNSFRGLAQGALKMPLATLERFQSFQTAGYFRLLGKKYAAAYVAVVLFFGAGFLLTGKGAGLAGACMIMVLTPLVFFWRYHTFRRTMTAEVGVGELLFRGIAEEGIIPIISLAAAAGFAFIMGLVGYGLAQDGLSGLDFHRGAAGFVSYGDLSLGLALAACILLVVLVIQNTRLVLKGINVRAVSGVLVLLLFALALYIGCVNNVIVTEDSVRINHYGSVYEYDYSEAESFRLLEHRDDLDMEITFRDGRRVMLYSGVMSETDEYGEKYYGNASFLAYLADKLTGYGVEGSFSAKDKEALREIYQGYDAELQNALAQLVEKYD